MKRFLLAAVVVGGCANDVFVSGDAGGDAGTDVDTRNDGAPSCGVASSCGSGALCASFDDGTTGPFTDNSAGSGATQISSDERVTCPSSLLAKLGAVTAGVSRAVIIYKATIASASSAHARIDVQAWLPETTSGTATYIALRPNSDPTATVAIEAHEDGKWYLNLRASTNMTEIKPLVGAWNHFTFDVTFSANGSTGTATVKYSDDGNHQQSASLTSATLHTASSTISDITAQIGIDPLAVTTAPMSAYFDDISFTPN